MKLRVGCIVTLRIPSNQPSEGEWTWDNYLSGRYLITAIKHVFTSTIHSSILSLNKDSYASPIDSESDLMENLNTGVQ